MTQSASWSDRSDSSRTRWFAPVHRIDAVRPPPRMPVTLTILTLFVLASSTRSAVARRLSVNDSMSAIGLHPSVCARRMERRMARREARAHNHQPFGLEPARKSPPRRYLADELDLVALNVLDDHDLELGQKVQRELVDGVAQDGLLDQQDVAARLLDLLGQLQDVLALLLQDAVHLLVVVHDNLRLHLCCPCAHARPWPSVLARPPGLPTAQR